MIEVSTVPEMGNAGGAIQGDRAAYLAGLLNLRSPLPESLAWLNDTRDRAAAHLPELAIPSTRDEDWRFTDLSPLLAVQWQTAPATTVDAAAIAPYRLAAAPITLVFVDGHYVPELSATTELPEKLFVGDVAGAAAAGLQDTIQRYLATQPGAEETFTALNSASFTNAAVIHLGKNQVVDTPVHLLFVATQPTAIAHPRCLVIAEPNSQLHLVEDYISTTAESYVTNPVTEIWVAANAHVQHTRIQRDSMAAIHIGKTAVTQARDSRYGCTAVSLGAALSRHHLEIYQTGEQTDTQLRGLTLIRGKQVADTHSLISYTQPHGTGNQLHKCIVDDNAHAVFNGRIMVPQAAQMTDARQLSKALLLSPKARVDTKPQLEITADNVKCAHGATVSQLEADEVFYLQSRGIDQAQAVRLLTYAFAYEVLDTIAIADLRDTLLQYLT